tara:strand:+ start:811 stop:1032 length:222 start_codon:yes stop_codon:yes gene_type:complete
MKIKNILDRKLSDLTPEEKSFFLKHQESGENPLINICDKYKTIHYSIEMYWSDEHDLPNNYEALSEIAYRELS